MQNSSQHKQRFGSLPNALKITIGIVLGASAGLVLAAGAQMAIRSASQGLGSMMSPGFHHSHHSWKPTPLVSAVKANDVATVQRLLASGAQFNTHGTGFKEDLSPLGWAAITGHINIARLLQQHGATWSYKDPNDRTDLELAASWGSIRSAQKLLAATPSSPTKLEDERAALLGAAIQGQADMMRFLLQHGAKINPKSRDSEVTLWWVAEQGCDDAAKILLDHGVSPNARDEDGNSVLIASVVSRHEKLVREVFSHGADVTLRGNYTSIRGQAPPTDTALSIATANGDTHICQLLREAGATA